METRMKKDGSGLGSQDSATDSVDNTTSTSTSSCESGSSSDKSSLICPNSDSNPKQQVSKPPSEMEMMKERFAKLLLGEDMSGSGKGVCPSLAISNAITNLCATVFGQLWRLEPLPPEKKAMWQREMDWLLCTSDHIVELTPSWQTLPDGTKVEVMASRPRSDLSINLPALRKLDNLLLEILDGFMNTEFWYIDQGVIPTQTDQSVVPVWNTIQRQDDKWWLPVPRVPPEGLSESTRKHLCCKRDCAGQILKAAISINTLSLAEMEVPKSYLETLPKNGRACLGDVIYRYITSEQFSADCLLDCLDLSSEHIALEMANRVEAATHVWRRRQHPKPPVHPSRLSAKSSWRIGRDHVSDGVKKRDSLLVERANSLLFSLKQRFPGLTQTTLDATKILCNKDVGKSILESYSRVLESLAFNIAARIEDVLYVDDLNKPVDKRPVTPAVSSTPHKKKLLFPFPPVPVSGTPYRSISGTPYRSFSSTPTFSPTPLISPTRGERTPFLGGNCNKPPRRGMGVKRALTNYLGGESKVSCGNILEGLGSISSRIAEGTVSRLSMEGKQQSE